jgi:hypothetical protein
MRESERLEMRRPLDTQGQRSRRENRSVTIPLREEKGEKRLGIVYTQATSRRFTYHHLTAFY